MYRTESGGGGLVVDPDQEGAGPERADRRDYDVDHYVRVLRDTFAARLARAFTPGDFDAVFADPGQPSLFPASLATTRYRYSLRPAKRAHGFHKDHEGHEDHEELD